MVRITKKQFTLGKKWIAEGTIVEILDDEKVIICCFDNTLCDENPIDLVNLLNEQNEKYIEMVTKCSQLEKENERLRQQRDYLFDVIDEVLPHSGSTTVYNRMKDIGDFE